MFLSIVSYIRTDWKNTESVYAFLWKWMGRFSSLKFWREADATAPHQHAFLCSYSSLLKAFAPYLLHLQPLLPDQKRWAAKWRTSFQRVSVVTKLLWTWAAAPVPVFSPFYLTVLHLNLNPLPTEGPKQVTTISPFWFYSHKTSIRYMRLCVHDQSDHPVSFHVQSGNSSPINSFQTP